MITIAAPRGPALRSFLRHYFEMVAAMIIGMITLSPAESLLLNPIGWAELRTHPEINTLIMATNMTIAMVAWMRFRGHGWRMAAEMAAAMYLPLLLLLPPLWLGLISAAGLMLFFHILMLLAMAAVMLLRRHADTSHDHGREL